jgi:uncharacterized protein (TIGR00255 family)
MLCSMTGFGTSTNENEAYKVGVEVRTLNHRHLDIVIRSPRGYAGIEDRIREKVSQYVSRGRVEISYTVEELQLKERKVFLDKDLLLGYHRSIREALELIGASGEFTVNDLLEMPDVLKVQEAKVDLDASWKVISLAIDSAMENLVLMRKKEGGRLQEDILKRIDLVQSFVDQIKDRTPQVIVEYEARLRERIAKWLEEIPASEDRLNMEVALLADRSNIDEEIVRLNSHLQSFQKTCEETAIGRKLDFLIQEMHREINTIGQKSSDMQISSLVVATKAELDKIREQIQNIE